MNVYSELWELLRPVQADTSPVCFGTLADVAPLTVTIGDTSITKNLFYPRGTVFHEDHIGRTLALLPCEDGFLILFQAEGGTA